MKLQRTMYRNSISAAMALALVLLSESVTGMASARNEWTLQDCLDYALENNISLKKQANNVESGLEDTKAARAAFLPTLQAGSNQGASVTGDSDARYTGQYSISTGMTVYNGGQLRIGLQQKQLQNEIDLNSLSGAQFDIKLSIIQAYMQCLYSKQSVAVARNAVDLTQQQVDRAREMHRAGSISKVDLAQLESQLASDRYQVTQSQSTLANYMLQLKQLLELDIDTEMSLSDNVLPDKQVMRVLPDKQTVYGNALEFMPTIENSRLAIRQAELSCQQARAGFLPSLGLNAGLSTSNMSGLGTSMGSQMKDNFGASAQLSLTVPIVSGRQNRTAVNKARLSEMNSRLELENSQKELLRSVEQAYLDAQQAQAQFTSAQENEKYALESYTLTSEQFSLGMKNTVELTTAKNTLSQAQLSVLQAKYMALLNLEILDLYQGLK